jgi:hypothetical protein
MKSWPLILVALSALALTPRAEAVTLFAATSAGSPGHLYTIDPASGAVVQDIGSIVDASNINYPITGLAFNPLNGSLWGSTGNSVPATAATLVTIDPTTAQATFVGTFNIVGGGTMTDLAFDANGTLYGVGSVGGAHLYTIDTSSGQATMVGNSGLSFTTGGGLAISPDGTFYGTPSSNSFGTYDSTTGAYTNTGNPDKPAGVGAYSALSFDGSVLYGLNTGPGSPPPTHIVTIDPATAAVSDIGASLNSLDAIAIQPTIAALVGDYNANEVVDAADYVVYRKNEGTTNTLPNDPLGGTIGPDQYTQWRANFGKVPGSGLTAGTVPEPTTLTLFVIALAFCRPRRKFSR